MPKSFEQDAVGVGWRAELAADLLAEPAATDLVEVVAEACLADPLARREARAAAEAWPVVVHGVKLSLGSADGLEPERARRLGSLARELGAAAVSEHVAITRGGRREIGHLTTLPFTREAVAVVARNVAAARRCLPDVPFLLENVAWTFRWPEDAMAEGDFYAEIARATGCELLLDVANLYGNALNAGLDPLALLESHPLDRVGMVHLAGGVLEDGFWIDSHAHPTPAAVFELLERLFERIGPVPVILERDASFPPFCELRAELERAHALARAAVPHARPAPLLAAPADPAGGGGTMAHRQETLARMLTDVADPEPAACCGYGRPQDLLRTRAILERKRVDDALPLLPRTSRHGERARELGLAAVRGTQRAAARAGIADAFRIAAAAAKDAALAADAARDRLELLARFGADGRPRRGPYLGRLRLPQGGSVWAFKPPWPATATWIHQTRG